MGTPFPRSNIHVRMSPGEVRNLSWTKAAGVITIASANGTALSATNPGWVCVPSAVTAGTHVVLPVTANVTFNDDDHASSNLTNWLFGVTTGVAWNADMPVFIYALNKDDTAAALKFGISRNPKARFFLTANIGDNDAVPASDTQGSIYVAGSITEADYNVVPAIPIGATYMKKVAAANDWTIAASSAFKGIGQDKIDLVCGTSFDFPAGQNGAAAAKYFTANGGTAPTATASNGPIYTLSRQGIVDYSGYFSSIAGGGAAALQLALPYSNGSTKSLGAARVYGAGLGSLALFQAGATLTAGDFIYQSTIVSTVNTVAQNAVTDIEYTLKYKAF